MEEITINVEHEYNGVKEALVTFAAFTGVAVLLYLLMGLSGAVSVIFVIGIGAAIFKLKQKAITKLTMITTNNKVEKIVLLHEDEKEEQIKGPINYSNFMITKEKDEGDYTYFSINFQRFAIFSVSFYHIKAKKDEFKHMLERLKNMSNTQILKNIRGKEFIRITI